LIPRRIPGTGAPAASHRHRKTLPVGRRFASLESGTTFKSPVLQRTLMNPRVRFPVAVLLALAAAAVFAGCAGMTGPTPQPSVPTPEPVTPLQTMTVVTALPVTERARITVGFFGLDPAAADVYEFIGNLQVAGGPYTDARVILRYPDGQEYADDLGGMGGSEPTRKPFFIYPDTRYMGTNPEKIVALDGRRYPAEYRYENGVLVWIVTSDITPVPT